jgi:hypothetical protein
MDSLVPIVLYDLERVAVVPERSSVPVHEYPYVPLPPEAVALQSTSVFVINEDGVTAHDPVSGIETCGSVTVTVQDATDTVPAESRTSKRASFVPAVGYVLVAVANVPERLSVPVHV